MMRRRMRMSRSAAHRPMPGCLLVLPDLKQPRWISESSVDGKCTYVNPNGDCVPVHDHAT